MLDIRLAIVIPAYKAEYLAATLTSLQDQTNSMFKVYVGDDCSPYELKSIVDEFADTLNIVYHRFSENLGGTSLTKQWERCIELSNEDWIWLFSDDDIADRNAVQVFYASHSEKFKLYKFHTQVIDGLGQLSPFYSKFDFRNNFHGAISSSDYIFNRLVCNGFRSFAVEYIFHRSLYEKFRFVDFPLGWGADDATWFQYSLVNHRQILILDAKVFWRHSGINISSDVKSIKVIQNKLVAAIQYIKWLRNICGKYQMEVPEALLLRWLSVQIGSLNAQMGYHDFKNLIKEADISVSIFKVWASYFRVLKKNQFMNALKSK